MSQSRTSDGSRSTGLEVSELKRIKQLEEEHRLLKKMFADLSLGATDIHVHPVMPAASHAKAAKLAAFFS